MKILMTAQYNDSRTGDVYEPGCIYEVPEALGTKLVDQRWAHRYVDAASDGKQTKATPKRETAAKRTKKETADQK